MDGKKFTNDHNIDEYSQQVQAFLTKRWICKREVSPKVAIMDDMGESYRHIYYQQRLAFGEYLYDETRLEKLYKANNLNTTFLHSIYTEDYEKPLIEQCM